MSKASSKASKSSKTSSGSKSNTKPKHRGPNDANITAKKKKKNDDGDEVKSDDDDEMSPSSSSSFDLLSKKIARLETELAKESAYRNHAQLERDKTLQFWEISKRESRRLDALGRERERALEEARIEADAREREMRKRLKQEREACEEKVREMQQSTSEAIREAKRQFEWRVDEMLSLIHI